jgi:hypothetical protein
MSVHPVATAGIATAIAFTSIWFYATTATAHDSISDL